MASGKKRTSSQSPCPVMYDLCRFLMIFLAECRIIPNFEVSDPINIVNMQIIGSFYGNAGRMRGAECGARMLKRRLLELVPAVDGPDVDLYAGSDNSGVACLDEVVHYCTDLGSAVFNALVSGHRVIVVGGDHSMVMGSLLGSARVADLRQEKLGVIYIDAHADINTVAASATGNLHGVPLASSFGIEKDASLTALRAPGLETDDLLYLGLRSVDDPERQTIERYGIRHCTSAGLNEMHSGRPAAFAAEIERMIDGFIAERGLERLHVSVDIDVLDPRYAPATGVPEPDGISPDMLKTMLDCIVATGKVHTLDFVEYNPHLDPDGATEALASELLGRMAPKLS